MFQAPSNEPLPEQPKTPEPAKATSKEAAAQLEWVAYALFAQRLEIELRSDPPAPAASRETIREKWQGEAALRTQLRSEARLLIAILESGGLRIRPFNSGMLDKSLEWLRTIPPRAAYTDDEFENGP